MKLISFPSINSIKLALIGISLLFILNSCKKSHSDIGAVVFKETKNKIFKDIETDVFVSKFKEAYQLQRQNFNNPKFLNALYDSNDFEPLLLMKHLKNKELVAAVDVLKASDKHGVNPKTFKVNQLNDLITQVYNKKQIKTVDEAYKVLIDLELVLANSLSNYSNAMQFGLISPGKIYAQYYTATKRPDSSSFLQVFQTNDINLFLDSIQPSGKQYITLQKALAEKTIFPGSSLEETERILQVNLERLRWKNLPNEEKYVWVNIPDFKLDVIENGKSILNMKVCVGEGRNITDTDNLVEYDESYVKKDRPFNRETPQLKSLIHSVQVNPVWNIPESIATNEITKDAAKDPYYLANHNIDVFENGRLIEDPETIDWTEAGAGKKYAFKQRPGDDNSLGKIKFLFSNESSVYLHDTPAKAAFNKEVRAVSHGCVRVEKPLELAQALFGTGAKLTKIETGMKSDNPIATDISLPKQIPVYLAYFTCWADPNGTLHYRKDVYGLDVVLYSYLNKLAS